MDMSPQFANEDAPKRGISKWVWVALIVLVLCCCLVLMVPVVLSLLGNTINDVFNGINQSLTTP